MIHKAWVRLLPVMTACILSGCAYGTQGTQTKNSEPSQAPVILNVLAGQTAADAGTEDMINDLIAQKYPYVTLDWQTVEWGDEFDSMLRADFAAGEVPDIIIGKAQDISEYYKTGNLAKIDPSVFTISADVINDVRIGNSIYGVPYNEDYFGVIYNKDIFDRLALDIPVTKSELEKTVRILQENKITPFAFTCGDRANICSDTMQFMINEIFKYNTGWGDDFRMGRVFFDQSREASACFENNGYMLQHSFDDSMKLEKYECETRFAQGEAAMYVTGTGEMSRILQESGNTNFGIFPYPNSSGDAYLIRETDMTFMKSAETSDSGLVDEIIKTIAGDRELASEMAEFTQKIPLMQDTGFRYMDSLQNDIDRYENRRMVIDSLSGYRQLSWSYMSEITDKQIEWLQGYTTLDKVLYYAELKRPDSFNSR